MRTVFLDANIILEFFRFGEDDLGQIRKLVALVEDKELKILTNTHLQSEVRRNREKVLFETLRDFKKGRLDFRAPRALEGNPQVEEIQKALKKSNQSFRELANDFEKMAKGGTLPADYLVEELLSSGDCIEVTSDIIRKAKLRCDLGNPPGKSGSIGDAIHWEVILEEVRYSIDVVSRDADFASKLDEHTFSPFLQKEWLSEKGENGRNVRLFRSISDFFEARFPDIKLSEHAQKNELIEQLADSPSFTSTHAAIAKLDQFESFTNGQVVRLFAALVANKQVRAIAKDRDVEQFFTRLQPQAYWVPTEDETIIATALGVDQDEFFIPF
ncbi:MAG: PIN domain-containing protein [Rhodobacteraceae bacterium]|nr:PIN domain-containing protein [Paracoccaceae bacterium]